MQIKSTFAIAVVLGASAALTGCTTETIDSSDIKTSGIAATIEVTAPSASESTVHVTLRAGGDESNTYVVLGGNDHIFATVAGDKKQMPSTGEGEYEAEFAAGAADADIAVRLERDGETPVESTGKLPAPFDVTDVSGTVSRADDLEIKWAPSDSDSMHIDVDGTCIFNEDIDVPGNQTSQTIAGGTLDSTGPADMPKTCDLTVTVERLRTGTAAREFDAESSFSLKQVRKTKITSAP